jgi:hypothetical protein
MPDKSLPGPGGQEKRDSRAIGEDERLQQRPDPPGPAPAGTRLREPHYCLRCRTRLRPYRLHELEQSRCPRCKLPYDPDDPATYSTRGMALRWKFWLPGFGLAVLAGVVAYATILWTGDLGYALFFAVAFSVGGVIGYTTRLALWLTVVLAAVAVTVIVFTLVCLGFAGLFCGLTLDVIFLGPAVIGGLAGWLLGVLFQNVLWDRRRSFFLLFWIALPYLAEAVEHQWPVPQDVAEVRTGLTFHASPEVAWRSIQFYEQVEHEPPWLLTLALPRPVRAEGSKAAVGDVQRCLYRRGYLVKQITRREEQRLLAFRVTEQHLHFERDVTLLDGSFAIQPLEGGYTRVVLTTRYVRHLRPAWLWEPLEREIVHTLHGHVLKGMRRQARQEGADQDPEEPAAERLAAR